jgi:hypothetical protein
MTTFNISDITPAGAFTNAVTAAQSSDRRSAIQSRGYQYHQHGLLAQ